MYTESLLFLILPSGIYRTFACIKNAPCNLLFSKNPSYGGQTKMPWSLGYLRGMVSWIPSMLGLLGGKWDNDESTGHVTSRLALIGGTSTCHMVVRELNRSCDISACSDWWKAPLATWWYVSSSLELENLCESLEIFLL